jgi:hypothetical protein
VAGAASHLLACWAIARLGSDRVSFDRQSPAPVNFHLDQVRSDAGEVGFVVTADSPEILAALTLATIDHPAVDLEFGVPPQRSWPVIGPGPRPVGYLWVRLGRTEPGSRGIRRAGRRG